MKIPKTPEEKASDLFSSIIRSMKNLDRHRKNYEKQKQLMIANGTWESFCKSRGYDVSHDAFDVC